MAIAPDEITALIAVGGASSRFGQDKATYVFRGEQMVTRTLRIAGPVAGSVLLGGSGDHRSGVGMLPDDPPGIGPLGSLAAGLRHCQTPWLLFLACDLPGLETAHLACLTHAGGAAPACVARSPDGLLHPMVGLYAPILLPELREAIERRSYSLQALCRQVGATAVDLPASALVNMNRPGDIPSK